MRRPLALTALLAVVLAGCGNERRVAPELRPELSTQTQKLDFPAVGLALELPRNFTVSDTERPGVFRAAFGEATVSAFAYRRREQLPRNQKELDQALTRLEKATQERSQSFDLSGSSTLELDGARAVGLLGQQTISQSPLRTRSLHIFKGDAEYVIELLAPPREFERLDQRLLAMIRSTLDVTGEVSRAGS